MRRTTSEPEKACLFHSSPAVIPVGRVGDARRRGTIEQAGPVLLKLADKLESRSQMKLDMLVKLLEPLMMVVMAVIVGFLVIALLMPCLKETDCHERVPDPFVSAVVALLVIAAIVAVAV